MQFTAQFDCELSEPLPRFLTVLQSGGNGLYSSVDGPQHREMRHMPRSSRLASLVALFTVAIVALAGMPLSAQTPQRRPAPQAPQQKPQTAVAPAAQPAEPVKPPAPLPQADVRFKTTYTAEGLKTESVTYVKGQRERFEFQDIVLLKQHDQKRTIQIMKAANTYLVVADGAPAVSPCRGAGCAASPAGRRERDHDHRGHRRTEGGLRAAGAPREDDDRQAADAGCV